MSDDRRVTLDASTELPFALAPLAWLGEHLAITPFDPWWRGDSWPETSGRVEITHVPSGRTVLSLSELAEDFEELVDFNFVAPPPGLRAQVGQALEHPRSLEALWRKVERLRGTEPFCYQSEAYAHSKAAEQVAVAEGLTGEDLATWNEFVDGKTRSMSGYVGD